MARNKIKIVCLCIFILFFIGFWAYNHPFRINSELISTLDAHCNDKNRWGLKWISIIDHQFYPFWDEEYLLEGYSIDIKEYEFIDTSKYSYIVTYELKLERLYMSAATPGNENYFGFFLLPKQFNGIAKLTEGEENKLYIYRIPKINIVNNLKFEKEVKEKYDYLLYE